MVVTFVYKGSDELYREFVEKFPNDVIRMTGCRMHGKEAKFILHQVRKLAVYEIKNKIYKPENFITYYFGDIEINVDRDGNFVVYKECKRKIPAKVDGMDLWYDCNEKEEKLDE